MSPYVLPLVIGALAVIGAIAVWSRGQAARLHRVALLDAALTTSCRAAEEDLLRFTEDLTALAEDEAISPAARGELDEASRCLGRAQAALATVSLPQDVATATSSLQDGRQAICRAQAVIAGLPVPEPRPPCFFNPAHGPSVANVGWTPPGLAAIDVPACQADVERVGRGADPYVRTVQFGDERVPWWQGGLEGAPWARGYFEQWTNSPLTRGIASVTTLWESDEV